MYDLFTKHKGAGALQSAPSGGKRTIIPIAKSASSSSTSTFSTALEQTELRTITAALSKIQEQLVTFKERAGGITGDLELMRAEMETSEMFAGEGEEESDVVAVVVNTDASAGRTSASTAASSDAKRRKKKR